MRTAFPRVRFAGRLAVAILMAAGTSAALFAVDTWDTPDAKWRQGPVKYLLTKQEEQAYKKLKTEEERTQFVEAFWEKRDPTPGTPENEYRDEFYRLARDAAARFTENGGKGWQDDRGRVYILLGVPDEITEGGGLLSAGLGSGAIEQNRETGGFGGPGGGDARPDAPVKTIKFIYHRNPFGGDGSLELSFTGDVTGGFRLDDRLDWDNPVLLGLAPTANRVASAPPAAPAPGEAPATPPAAPPAGGMEAPPGVEVPEAPVETPQSELMEMVRSTGELKTTIPLDVTVNYYKAADKSTFATLTLEVKRASLPAESDPDALVISAEVIDPDTGESLQRFFKSDQFGPFEGNLSAGINDTLLFQAERPLNPGRYNAIFALKDPTTGEIGKLERALEVPSFQEDRLQLSTVTLARKIQPAPIAATEGEMRPFVLGPTRVVPRPDNVYKEGEDLSFYYQIYNATLDAVTNLPKLELSYAFEKSIGGKWRMVGGRPILTPGATGLVQAFTIPMKTWPAGDYRITIKVTDTIAGTRPAAEAAVPPAGQEGTQEAAPPAAAAAAAAPAAGPVTVEAMVPFTIQGPPQGSKAKSKG